MHLPPIRAMFLPRRLFLAHAALSADLISAALSLSSIFPYKYTNGSPISSSTYRICTETPSDPLAISSQRPYTTAGLPFNSLIAVVTIEVYIHDPITNRNISQSAFSIPITVFCTSSSSKSGSSGIMISISGSCPKVFFATSTYFQMFP